MYVYMYCMHVTGVVHTKLYTGAINVLVSPAVHSVEVTEMVQLTCVADGYRSYQFRYQWRINGANIDNATDKVFTISSVSEGDSGTYDCVVINYWNDMNTSNPAQLIVTSKAILDVVVNMNIVMHCISINIPAHMHMQTHALYLHANACVCT